MSNCLNNALDLHGEGLFQAMGDGRIQDSGAGKSFLERSRLINRRKMHPGKKEVTQVQGKCAERNRAAAGWMGRLLRRRENALGKGGRFLGR